MKIKKTVYIISHSAIGPVAAYATKWAASRGRGAMIKRDKWKAKALTIDAVPLKGGYRLVYSPPTQPRENEKWPFNVLL